MTSKISRRLKTTQQEFDQKWNLHFRHLRAINQARMTSEIKKRMSVDMTKVNKDMEYLYKSVNDIQQQNRDLKTVEDGIVFQKPRMNQTTNIDQQYRH
jgi:hypothetical protein